MRQQRVSYLDRLHRLYVRRCYGYGAPGWGSWGRWLYRRTHWEWLLTTRPPLCAELWEEIKRERRAPKVKAHAAVRRAIKQGVLTRPDTCSKCGTTGKVIAHHTSYEPEHWLDVHWLCPRCHGAIHYERGVI